MIRRVFGTTGIQDGLAHCGFQLAQRLLGIRAAGKGRQHTFEIPIG